MPQKEFFSVLIAQAFFAVIIGVLVAVTAQLFVEGARYLLSFQEATEGFVITVSGQSFSLLPIPTMLTAALLIILVRKTLGVTKWSGPADSIYALQQPKIGVDIKLGIGSTLAAFISAGGGASVGQYGPLVHFGATLSTLISKVTKTNISKDVLIACGVAAAISAGFNAPIAGIIFAHEALLRRFSIGAVAPISVSAIVASAFNQYLFGSNLAFNVPTPELELASVVPFVIIFAPLCSAAAVLYMVTLRKFQSVSASAKFSFTSLILFTALVGGTIGTFIPEVLGLGGTQINQIINATFSIEFLILILFGKILMTSMCIGFGFFGGVFGPALFIGAALGGVLSGLLIKIGLPADYISIISIASMAAVGSSVIGAPITVVLIVVELTGSYEFGLMALLSVTLSSSITYKLFGLSFFDRQLLDRGVDLRRGREYIHMTQISVGELESSDYLSFSPETDSDTILKSLKTHQMTEAYIIDDQQNLVGKLSIHDLLEETNYLDSLDRDPLHLTSSQPLTEALEVASEFVGESIPILEGSKLKGAINEGDLFKKILDIEDSLRSDQPANTQY